MPREPQPYKEVLAGNIAAARGRMRLRQSSLAERMRQLGWERWHPQTVSEVEAGRRDLRADELLGLSIALETNIATLMAAPLDVGAVKLPAGTLVGATRLFEIDGTTSWDGDRPKITPPSGATPIIDANLAGKREELRRLEAYVDEVRRQARGEPVELAPPHPDDLAAEDLPPGYQPPKPPDG
jgi:transcriptional regulator with XRE-family HTH domain